jgi:hypothetical protein
MPCARLASLGILRCGLRGSEHGSPFLPKTAEPRWWRVSVIKKNMVYLGRVLAVGKVAAMVEAAKEFTNLTDHERSRLVIEEQP